MIMNGVSLTVGRKAKLGETQSRARLKSWVRFKVQKSGETQKLIVRMIAKS